MFSVCFILLDIHISKNARAQADRDAAVHHRPLDTRGEDAKHTGGARRAVRIEGAERNAEGAEAQQAQRGRDRGADTVRGASR